MATYPSAPQPPTAQLSVASLASLPAALAIIPELPRPVLERLTHCCIDRLDELEPDPDIEPNGDELDGTMGEDDFCLHPASGPGCPVSDPEEDDLEDGCAAGDDGCGLVVRHGVRFWGADHEENGRTVPIYGIDQSEGPVSSR